MYPSYEQLLKAKKAAYPPGIVVHEKYCEISLQSLLNNTCSRLLQMIEEAGSSIQENSYILICKYGFDGSSGHSNYKQA